MAHCDVCGNFDNDEGAIGDPNYQPDLYYQLFYSYKDDYYET